MKDKASFLSFGFFVCHDRVDLSVEVLVDFQSDAENPGQRAQEVGKAARSSNGRKSESYTVSAGLHIGRSKTTSGRRNISWMEISKLVPILFTKFNL